MKCLNFFLLQLIISISIICFGRYSTINLNNNEKYFFIENKGQWDEEVLFLCRLNGLDAWITKYGVNYTFYKIENIENFTPIVKNFDDSVRENIGKKIIIGHRVLLRHIGYDSFPGREVLKKRKGYYNYFIGKDPLRHANFVGLYGEAIIKNVYPGIDIRYYFDKGSLRYDYVIKAGSDPGNIMFYLEGAYEEFVGERRLNFKTRFGEVCLMELRAFQGDHEIECNFKKEGKIWRIELGEYDKKKDLIIDPLIYSTFIGGSNLQTGRDITLDASGNAYITGDTYSTDYDITPGAFQTMFGGGSNDIIVTKINAAGNALIYSTFIGGNDFDIGMSICIDVANNTYITGWTASGNFAITPGAYQTTNNGNFDIIVVKLNASGSALIYSTYLGGNGFDHAKSIKVDNSGNTYITGHVSSTDYDITSGAFQTSYGGGSSDVIVTKLNAMGNALIYSTYIGGSANEWGNSIDLDTAGNTFITGWTTSTNFDVTTGSFQTTLNGSSDIFVTRLNNTGSSLMYSTLLGGSNSDEATSIVVDDMGNAYITGMSYSTNYDVTPGAFQTIKLGINSDVIVTKLNAAGNSLIFSTYLGGNNSDSGYDIEIDSLGNVYLTGETNSTNFDLTTGAFQTTYGGGSYDIFVTKLNAIGNSLLYSTFVGGSDYDFGNGIAIDTNEYVYITGGTYSFDYDITNGSYQILKNGQGDIFITKISICTIFSITTSSNSPICSGQVLNLNVNSIPGATYSWTGPNGFTSSQQNPSIVNASTSASGLYTVTVVDINGCSDSSSLNVIVNPVPIVNANSNSPVCEGQTLNLTVNTTAGATYSWTGPNGFTSSQQNPSIVNASTSTSGLYTVTVTDVNGCVDSNYVNVIIYAKPVITLTVDTVICIGDTITLTAGGGTSYLWSNGSTDSSITISPSTTTAYQVVVTNSFGCKDSGQVTITVSPIPDAQIYGDNEICQGESTMLTATGGNSFLWSNGSTDKQIIVNPLQTTTYQVLVKNDYCEDSTVFTVIVNELPLVMAGNDTTIDYNGKAWLWASGGINYIWQPTDGLSCSTCNETIATPDKTTEYCVIAADHKGCHNKACVLVKVESQCGEIFVPNVFSPNEDGSNDQLSVFGNCIVNLWWEIYNRWGEKVYFSDDKQKSWDGTYKGQPVKSGEVYYYFLRAVLPNNKIVEKKGTITIVK